MISKVKAISPLFLVLAVGFAIALANIVPGTFLSGWDNVHAEFNLGNYARRVLFGAWQEHQGLGGPAAQGHAAEIARLPILYLLSWFLPLNLQRYAFIFLMYIIGGVGAFYYLKNFWLSRHKNLSPWIASLGAIFYLLNTLTLQQFYIVFEMFAVQFAGLPFLLMSIHYLARGINKRSLLVFILIQFFIAPSAHTPTVFYLGMLFSVVYAFFLAFKKHDLRKSLVLPLVVFFMSLFANSYWIIPNVYFVANNSNYVSESLANRLFNRESLWSIRSEGDWGSFLTGIHYLFSWKDYDFGIQSYEFIFEEWLGHFANNLPRVLLAGLGVAVLLGLLATVVNRRLGFKRWGIIVWYLFTVLLVWVDLFPTKHLVDYLYKSEVFLEAFRNPFTKFSIILSFVWTILFSQFLESTLDLLGRIFKKRVVFKAVFVMFFISVLCVLVLVAWPSFQGNFINEKLRVYYPQEYFELFSYMKSRGSNLRILELPYYTHEGWIHNDWSLGEKVNGYQGIGLMFFGISQPFLTPDFARWTGSVDSFYYELRAALNDRDAKLFNLILDKYGVDLIALNDKLVNPYATKDTPQYPYDKLLFEAGYRPVWNRDSLTLFERDGGEEKVVNGAGLILPKRLTFISADLDRVSKDVVFMKTGDYVNIDDSNSTKYPFANLLVESVGAVVDLSGEYVTLSRSIPKGDYAVIIPGIEGEGRSRNIPVFVGYEKGKISIVFPKFTVTSGGQEIEFTTFDNLSLTTSRFNPDSIWLNNYKINLNDGQRDVELLRLTQEDESLLIRLQSRDGRKVLVGEQPIPWDSWQRGKTVEVTNAEEISVRSYFPWMKADLNLESTNCGEPKRGSINTLQDGAGVVYYADGYGVNCVGYAFENLITQIPLLVNVAGENIERRSIKLFINDRLFETITKQYLLPDKKFDVVYSLPAVGTTKISKYLFNWETRSFKIKSVNRLTRLQVVPFPLEQVAGVQLVPDYGGELVENKIEVESYLTFPDATLRIMKVDCQGDKCFLGLDQAYDDLWLAVDTDSLQLLPHFRLNNWANVWEVGRSSNIAIFYLPELMLIFLLAGVIFTTLFMVVRLRK